MITPTVGRYNTIPIILIFIAIYTLLVDFSKIKLLNKTVLTVFTILFIGYCFTTYRWWSATTYYQNDASDWAKYSKLINLPRFCIPTTDNYWIIKKGYDYLQTIKPTYIKNGKIFTTDIYNNNYKVLSLTINYPQYQSIYAIAYDKNGNFLGKTYSLTSKDKVLKYLIFKPFNGLTPYKIVLYNEDNSIITNPTVQA